MFLIASDFDYKTKNENGIRFPHKISNRNGILTFIDRYTLGHQCLLVIANDPEAYDDNDNLAQVLWQALAMSQREFTEVKVLDYRTCDQAEQLIKNADLIFMRGGEVLRQLKFLQQINFKQLIENYHSLVITVSAASMCLTKTICNFPEHENELELPRVVNGLGLIDIKLIPHFDSATLTYQGDTDFPHIIQDYILPYSDEDELYALPNGSFILFDGTKIKFFGPYDKIFQRKVVRFNVKGGNRENCQNHRRT